MVSTTQTRNRIDAIDWSFVGRTGFWLEVMWLGALALVPILFSYNNSLVTFDETKSYALHFFALMTLVLLVTDTVNTIFVARRRGEDLSSFDVGSWLRADRANMFLGAVVLFIFVYMLSTAFSQSPFFSFWGIILGTDGYNLYTFLSFMVIFFAIATRLRKNAQVWRILYLIIAVGVIASIYGTAQHFGWDPLWVIDSQRRVFSSFGNPIYFGAYLVMSIPITMAVALDPRLTSKKFLMLVIALALGLQIAAMWFTGSRGPLVGLIAGGFVTVVAMVILVNRRQLVYPAVVIASGLVVAVVLILIPGGAGDARAVQFGGELSALTDQQQVGFIQGGLGGRAEIWKDVLEISVSWDTFQEDNSLARVFRPLFGLGPDMLRFSSSLVSRPRSSLEIVDHAHNRALQVLAEIGWVGLLAFLLVVGLAIWLLFLSARSLFRFRGNSTPANTGQVILFIAVAGALAGAAAEQLSGVGRISDLLTSWVLLALVVVLYRQISGARVLEGSGIEVVDDGGRKPGKERFSLNDEEAMNGIPFFFGVIFLVAALMTFVLVDVQMLRASRLMAGQTEAADAGEVYTRFINARNTAPQVEQFTTFTADVLITDARNFNAAGDKEQATELAAQAFDLLLDYHQRNPLSIRTRILLAETAALLLEIGLIDFREEMVIRYEELVAQFPNEARVLSVTANAYAAADRFEDSLAMADRALALEPLTEPLPSAWWIRGVALDRLGRTDEAIIAFETSIEKGPTSQFAPLSHRDLAKIYDEQGNEELAEFHLEAAKEIEATRAANE